MELTAFEQAHPAAAAAAIEDVMAPVVAPVVDAAPVAPVDAPSVP